MAALYLGFEEERDLRTCRVVGSVLGTFREEEYLVAEVDPPFSGEYLDREEAIGQVILAVVKAEWHGRNVKTENQYFNRDEGIREVVAALQHGEVPSALAKIQILVECVVYPEPLLKKKIDERRLKKIGVGSIHTNPDVASGRSYQKKPGFWARLFGGS